MNEFTPELLMTSGFASGCAALLVAVTVSTARADEAPKRDVRGVEIGMSLAAAMNALTRSGAVCGKGVFDTHRCDFDSDTWIHLHVVGPGKTVKSLKYVYPAQNGASEFAAFRAKVIKLYGLAKIDNRTKFVTPAGVVFTITDGEIDLESEANPDPIAPEPKL